MRGHLTGSPTASPVRARSWWSGCTQVSRFTIRGGCLSNRSPSWKWKIDYGLKQAWPSASTCSRLSVAVLSTRGYRQYYQNVESRHGILSKCFVGLLSRRVSFITSCQVQIADSIFLPPKPKRSVELEGLITLRQRPAPVWW